ncbi:fructose-specific PTS transporter subunit EIIC [Streptomyces marincola]|uniref:fructose-specific PTS transporter subunit EIIC n=1 Tax=Streptomyces marincola TaxID=2878388 RepID=UPI001CF57C8F|nr:fructose-specific PTS transporter subunit EIIC [Streptomyces marincola]UCM88599.1 fructose-specific PTS transporter subunit EIIC [Streptomyces marincola]
MNPLITADLVDLDLDRTAAHREGAARALAARMAAAGRVTDVDAFLADVAAREAQAPTGLEGGIGIPHCRSAHVTEPTLAFGRSSRGIDFGAPDGPAHLIFLIAAPAGGDRDHLSVLSALARDLMDPQFTRALRETGDPARAASLLRGPSPTPSHPSSSASPAQVAGGDPGSGSGTGTDGTGTGSADGTGTGGTGGEPGPQARAGRAPRTPADEPSSRDERTPAAEPFDPTPRTPADEPFGRDERTPAAPGTSHSPDAHAAESGAAPPDAHADGAHPPRAGTHARAEGDGPVPHAGRGPVPGAGTPARADGGRVEAEGAAAGGTPFRIVAVTACPTGIAHTYLAAEALRRAADEADGIEIAVEPQGSGGFERLPPELIARADAVILAHDVEVRDRARFDGKPTVDTGVKAAVSRPGELIARARAAPPPDGVPGASRPAPMERAAEPGDHLGTRLRKWLMTGVSYMVPFVAAGGLLIALAFALGGYEISDAPAVADHFSPAEADSWAALAHQIGSTSFTFLIPVLAGYIAYGMADRPGLVPGFTGGAIAVTVEAGFLGGLAAGLLAGAVVLGIRRVRVPPALRGIMPVVVIPLLSAAAVGLLMFVVVGRPIAEAQSALTDWLNGLGGANAVLLGALLGLMMCFDLGGPVNKVAYAFATGGIAVADPGDTSLEIMAAVMAAGMVPPLGLALATTVRGRLFTSTEKDNGKAAWVLGASFITEGAIPFAAADPLRVIPSAMAGGALTGALAMAAGSTLRAPHGGVFVVPLVGGPALYLLSIAAGTVVTAALVVLLKHRRTADGPGRGPAQAPGATQAR